MPESLTYLVPPELQGKVEIGTPVLAPLGGREQLGYVVGLGHANEAEEGPKLRPLLGITRPEPAFDSRTLELLQWLAHHYRASVADALPLAAPERHGVELQTIVYLNEWDGTIPPRTGLLTRQTLETLYQTLKEADGCLLRGQLLEAVRAPNAGQVLRRARSEGWVREERVLVAPRVQARMLKAIRLPASVPAEPAKPTERLGPRQRAVLDHLAGRGDQPVLQRDLCAVLEVDAAVISGLVKRGLLEATELAVRRVPQGYGTDRDRAPELNPFQAAAAGTITSAMRRGEGESLLLFGVTGSGKTEVYLHAIEQARASGRSAALLVPEISLTAQVATAVRRRLGDRVAILHSALSDGERFDEWERVRKGEADVVVGPRSALFAPLKDPALLILDEEHDGSYKQSGSPRYHARLAAQRRATLCGGCTVLGSATPSVESFHAAQSGRYRLLELPERVRQRPLPSVEVVDLREESRARPGTVFGQRLEESIRARLAAGEQTILFLNRRGYSSFLLCRDCGHVPRCPNCDVSLNLHRQQVGALRCHHCDYTRPAPRLCERCRGARVKQFGIGTQKVEDSIRELFPHARVARLDRDSMATKDAHTRVVSQVLAGEIDILVGTQMVTKGFDFPGVTLVGVVTADVALNVPDFRAAERCFQLLTQVSGRAGRGETPGEVVVQAFNPEHRAITAAARHDYRGFYAGEIRAREELGYPPFGALARLLSLDEADAVARGRIEAAATILEPLAIPHKVLVRGPAPCPLSRLQDRFRYHLLLKAETSEALHALLDEAWPILQKRVGGLGIDVDPQDLL
jgi:primosomal protein N' (replication factor Y)